MEMVGVEIVPTFRCAIEGEKKRHSRSQQRVGRWDPGSFLSKLELGPGGVVGDGGEGGGVLVAEQGQVLREGRGA